MGDKLKLEHANILAYLTIKSYPQPPRLQRDMLMNFLESFKEGEIYKHMIVSDKPCREEFIKAAKLGIASLKSELVKSDEILEDDIAERSLIGLKELVSRYLFYGLSVGSSHDIIELREIFMNKEYSSNKYGLILYPEPIKGEETFCFLDAFRPITKLAEQIDNWPGMLFWCQSGFSSFRNLSNVRQFLSYLLNYAKYGLHAVELFMKTQKERITSKKVLHLSDTHFGKRDAARNIGYLEAHLDNIAKSIDCIIITGDLYDSPTFAKKRAFDNFKRRLTRITEKIIIVPGNHDQKLKGVSLLKTLGRRFKPLAEQNWSQLEIDHRMGCIFIGFNSSLEADFSRGKVTKDQRVDRAADLETAFFNHPEILDYFRVVLIHHHPFSFEVEPITRGQRFFSAIGVSGEAFLHLEEADEFLNWCAERNVSLVLHGHKHVQKYFKGHIPLNNRDRETKFELTSIGCGSSTGADVKFLSYNIIYWDNNSKRWGVIFYADKGDGSGFIPQSVALHSVELVYANRRNNSHL